METQFFSFRRTEDGACYLLRYIPSGWRVWEAIQGTPAQVLARAFIAEGLEDEAVYFTSAASLARIENYPIVTAPELARMLDDEQERKRR